MVDDAGLYFLMFVDFEDLVEIVGFDDGEYLFL